MTARNNATTSRTAILVLVLAIVHCFAFVDRMLLALLAPLVRQTLRLDDFQTGLLLGTVFVLAYATSSFSLRTLADHRDRLRLILVGILISGLATAACGLATSFASMAVARAGLGIAQSVLSPAALSLIAQIVPRGRLGRSVSLYTSGSTLGRSLALVLGGGLLAFLQVWIAARHGSVQAWRLVFFAFALPSVPLAFVVHRFTEPTRMLELAPHVAYGAKEWLRRFKVFYLSHTAAAAATVLVIQTVTAWTTTLLARRFGVSTAAAGSTFGLIVLMAAPLGHWLGGAILDRLHGTMGMRTPGAIMAAALLIAVPLTSLLGLAPGFGAALFGLTVLTLVMGIASPSGLAAIQLSTPDAIRGRVTSLFLTGVTMVGFGLGPAALGFLTDRVFGAQNIGQALLLVVSTAAMIGIASVLLQWKASTALPDVSNGRSDPHEPAF